jgi:predicted nucleotide-binding protein
MDDSEVVSNLTKAGIRIVGRRRNENDSGWRIDCACGAVVNIYDTGSVTVQGKGQAPVKRALALSTGERPGAVDEKRILIVARTSIGSQQSAVVGAILDEPALTKVEEVLRRWGVELPDL